MFQSLHSPQLHLLQEEYPDDATIQGYVMDNMEGAVDQATFLARTDIPIAVIGARGTGKMYIAKIVHQESAGIDGRIVTVDCREFRNREEANNRIRRELERAEGNTLVLKSPHLMNPEVQNRLARQLSTRTLADANPPRYLPRAKFVALFPDSIEHLLEHGGLTQRLASVFAGYPINVPPIKDRKRAVMRWAQKILGQECENRGRQIRGFSPDAEKAMLDYEWPGNITEMRQRIVSALDNSQREWLTPVDLGIYRGEGASAPPSTPELKPFLGVVEKQEAPEEIYQPSAIEALDVALGQAVNSVLGGDEVLPLGSWLSDEIVLSVIERYRDDGPAAARFLGTKSRNISRWMPRIEERSAERTGTPVWRECRRLVGEWIREIPVPEEPPQHTAEELLIAHLEKYAGSIPVKVRAQVMALSVPTYQKRLKQIQDLAT